MRGDTKSDGSANDDSDGSTDSSTDRRPKRRANITGTYLRANEGSHGEPHALAHRKPLFNRYSRLRF